MPKVSVELKGSAPDASSRTEFLRRKAIIAAQVAKNPTDDQTQKPLIGEHHLQKGFTNGIVEYRFTKGLNVPNRFSL
jgi:hypothetical protein